MADKIKSYYKYEIANMAGVSIATLRRWMEKDANALAAFGVSKNTHLLPPAAVKYLAEKYVIDLV